MENIKTDKAALKKFGLIMGLFSLIVAAALFIKHRQSALPAAIVALAFFLIAISMPGLLKYLYIVWMKLAFILSWFNARLLLCVIFYLVLSPVGLIMRIFRVDFLERRFNPSLDSYWKAREKKQPLPEDYTKQF